MAKPCPWGQPFDRPPPPCKQSPNLKTPVLGLVSLCVVAALACGSSDDPAAPPPPPPAPGEVPDGPDLPPAPFPLETPDLFGYALQDAFPGTFLSGAMDAAWPAGSDQPFVLQRGGDIVRLRGNTDPSVVLDFENQVAARAEAGALGMALHPKFADRADPHPFVYVWYNAEGTPTKQRLSRWTWNDGNQSFDAGSERVLVEQDEGAPEHNGAHIRFGPDGLLYFGNGDDTRPDETTQRLDAGLFSGIFRIDVDERGQGVSHAPPRQPNGARTQGYFIPNDNPFVGVANANEEYFALGFRNPYSFSFDRQGGALWLGDVGDTFREEIDRVEAGGNYGWPLVEGTKSYQGGTPTIGAARAPIYEYTHASVADLASTIGGYVYRGKALPELAGKFFFSDWPTGRVWALDTKTATRSSLVESNPDNAPVGWAEDEAGEVYLIAWSKILKIVRAPKPHTVPLKLSDTHLFRNLSTLKTSSSLHPYTLISPLWSDGAAKQRWVYVPPGQKAKIEPDGTVALPPGSLLVKQFDLPAQAAPTGGRSRRIETRVIVIGKDKETAYGVTYRWNREGTDADLVLEAVDEDIGDAAPGEARRWHFPSTGECASCHTPANRVLGFRGEQIDLALEGGRRQLEALTAANVLEPGSVAPRALASPADVNASLEDRAMAYLAANCSACHHPGASYQGGEETWNARPGVAVAKRGLVGAPHHNDPMAAGLGLPNAPLVDPGNPAGSLLLQRLKTPDAELAMPPILRTRVDPVGVAAVEAWIASLRP